MWPGDVAEAQKKTPKKGFLGLSGATMGGFTKHKKLAEYNPFAFF